jgi:hypothetical protein
VLSEKTNPVILGFITLESHPITLGVIAGIVDVTVSWTLLIMVPTR